MDFKHDNFTIHFDLKASNYEEDGPAAYKYFLYSLMISSIVLSQIAGSVWLLRKVGDSETLAKSVL